jgi:hypothetical protein
VVKPTKFLPDPDEAEEILPEVTPEALAAQKRAEDAAARRRQREAEAKTRRSWYTTAAAADAFSAAVDDIHHATRAPKHAVVAALMQAAVGQATRVENDLSRVAPMRRVREVRDVAR